MSDDAAEPSEADLREFKAELEKLHSTMSDSQKRLLEALVAAAAGPPEVAGFGSSHKSEIFLETADPPPVVVVAVVGAAQGLLSVWSGPPQR